MNKIYVLLILSCISGIGYAAEEVRIPQGVITEFLGLCRSQNPSLDRAKELLDLYPQLVSWPISFDSKQYLTDLAEVAVALEGGKSFEHIPLPADEAEVIFSSTTDPIERRQTFAKRQALHKISSDLDQDYPSPQWTTGLSLASMASNLSLVQLLYERAPDKQTLLNPTPEHDHPLANAICSGNPDLVRYLLDTKMIDLTTRIYGMTFSQYAGKFSGNDGQSLVQIILKPSYPNSQAPYEAQKYQEIHRLVIKSTVASLRSQSSTS